MHEFYLGGFKLELRDVYSWNHNAKHTLLELADGREAVLPNSPGLSDYSFEAWVDVGFLENFEEWLKTTIENKAPAEFVVIRKKPNGEMISGETVDVIISETVSFEEAGSNGKYAKGVFSLKEFVIPQMKYVARVSQTKFSINTKIQDTEPIPSAVESTGGDSSNLPDMHKIATGESASAEELKKNNKKLWSETGVGQLVKGIFAKIF